MKRRFFYILLAALLLLSTLPPSARADDAADTTAPPQEIWDGTLRKEPSKDGGGTLCIGTPGELAWLAYHVNNDTADTAEEYNVKLTADLDLGGKIWTPIGAGAQSFQGEFDGQGHTIRGLLVAAEDVGNYGLFGSAMSANIHDLTVEGEITCTGAARAGGVAGFAQGGRLTNCINKVKVTSKGTAGGLVGDADSAVISKCVNRGAVSCDEDSGGRAGGIAGSLIGSTGEIYACYNRADVSAGAGYAGGFAGELQEGRVHACYNTGAVTGTAGANPDVGLLTSGNSENNAFLRTASDQTGTGYYDKADLIKFLLTNFKDSPFVPDVGVNNGFPILPFESVLYPQTATVQLIVTDGTGSGMYVPGARVRIAPDPAPDGYEFAGWIDCATGALPEDLESADSSGAGYLTMPQHTLRVTPRYVDKDAQALSKKYTVRVSNGTLSAASVETVRTFSPGDTVTVTAAMSAGKAFVRWRGIEDLVPQSADLTQTTVAFQMPAGDVYVTAAGTDADFSVAVKCAMPSGNELTGGSTTAYREGDLVTLAAPEQGDLLLLEWQGTDDLVFSKGTKTSQTISFLMPAKSLTLTAVYAAHRSLTVSGGTINGTSAVSGNFAVDASVTVTAAAAPARQRFLEWRWSGPDKLSFTRGGNTEAEITFKMPDANLVLVAVYEDIPGLPDPDPAPTYTLTINSGTIEGAFSSSVSYRPGVSVTVTSNLPPAGKRFWYWGGADGVAFTGGTEVSERATFLMPERDLTLTAVYEDIPGKSTGTSSASDGTYDVTIYGGTISGVSGSSARFTPGDSVTVSANYPQTGRRFRNWSGTDGLRITGGNATAQVMTFTMPFWSVTLTAAYETIPSGSAAGAEDVYYYGGYGGYSSRPASTRIPVTGSGATTVTVSANISGRTASVQEIGDTALAQAAAGGTGAEPIVIDMRGWGQTVEALSVPSGTLGKIADLQTTSGLQVALSTGTLTFDNTTLRAIEAKADGPVSFALTAVNTGDLSSAQRGAVADRDVISCFGLGLSSGGRDVGGFGGRTVSVSVPFTPRAGTNARDYTVYYVSESGGLERIATACTSNGLLFRTEHFSDYVIVHESAKSPFADVKPDSYYYDAVQWATVCGITTGTGASVFSPDAPCTRAQIMVFLWRSAGSPRPSDGVMRFTDVPRGVYYYDAVQWALSKGITIGTTPTTFSPEQTVTRGQTAMFLYRAAGYPNVYGVNPFGDVPDSAYYARAVQWAAHRGITLGTGYGNFSPEEPCTRAQIMTLFYRGAL